MNLSSLRDRLDPARMAVREANRVRTDIAGQRAVATGMPGTASEQREEARRDRLGTALDRLMERVHAGDSGILSAIRRDGFHEVLRGEGLRVLMDAGQEAASAEVEDGRHAAAYWRPFPR